MKTTDKIAILGFGVEGRAMCGYLLRHGFEHVVICDQNADLDGVPEGVPARLGDEYLKSLSNFDVVFRSPGISFFRDEIQKLLGSRVRVSSMTKYFFEHCRVPIIGVTGTKGKGTTATLISEMLRRSGKKVFLGGNIGVPSVSFLDEVNNAALGEDSRNVVVVLELSSFQLADLHVSPHVAVVLNVTSEHLDYHSSIEEYRESKYPIVAFQGVDDIAVLNMDYPYEAYFGELGKGKKLYVSCQNNWADGSREVLVNGAWIDGVRGMDAGLWWDDQGNPDPRERGPREFMRVRDFGLLGRHNWENILPAVCVARFFDVDTCVIETILREFRGLPHRLEFVEMIGDSDREGLKIPEKILFYNDSFSTTPEACMAACQAFEDMQKPFFLIAGGSEKGSDFTSLGRKLAQMKFLQKIFLMGPAGMRIGDAVATGYQACAEDGTVCREPVACEMVADLHEAVEKATQAAKELQKKLNYNVRGLLPEAVNSEIVILMSPAAASFNEFINYKERGERFREFVRGR